MANVDPLEWDPAQVWIEPSRVVVPDDLRERVGGHPLVAQTLVRRGFSDVSAALGFLDPAYYNPAPATDIPNVIAAAERLERAIEQGETVCVWGDFDVDGQTSTTLFVSMLRDLGAEVIAGKNPTASTSPGWTR